MKLNILPLAKFLFIIFSSLTLSQDKINKPAAIAEEVKDSSKKIDIKAQEDFMRDLMSITAFAPEPPTAKQIKLMKLFKESVIEKIKNKKVDLNYKHKQLGEDTAMHIVAQFGDKELTELVFSQKGLKLNSVNLSNETPLFKAVVGKNLIAVKILVKEKAVDFNIQENLSGRTAFLEVLFLGNKDIMTEFFANLARIDFDLKDNRGNSARTILGKELMEDVKKDLKK